MPQRRLDHLHGAKIEVELEIHGSVRSVCGKGVYESSTPEFGSVLRIVVSDPRGNFEFLLVESKWDGCLESSDLAECDYRISLANCASL